MRVFPKEFNTPYRGEKFIWQKFCEFLPGNFVSYHGYSVGMKEPDIVLLCPSRGVLIIEVKGYKPESIVAVPDNNTIKKRDGNTDGSPYKQARDYKSLLSNELAKLGEDSLYIVPTVSYPFISTAQFNELGLSKVSNIDWTFTADDFADMELFFKKVDRIFDIAYETMRAPSLAPNGMSPQRLNNVRRYLENTDDIEDFAVPRVRQTESQNEVYSRLVFVKAKVDCPDFFYKKLIEDIKHGVVVRFFTKDADLLAEMQAKIDKLIKQKKLGDYKAFRGESKYSNHFYQLGLADVNCESFELVVDQSCDAATEIAKYEKQLLELDKKTDFNLNQYCIVHFASDNLIVSAGAGTGKTYSVVSRIDYLIWRHKYKAHELAKKIVMITFTNESADDMKGKIKEFFLHKQLLTSKVVLFDYYESISDLNICTIHSLAKKMLKKYSMFLGLGYGFSIEAGGYKKRQVIREALNDYVSENGIDVQESFQIPMYELVNRIAAFIGQLDNKNVEIRSNKFNFGTPTNPALFNLLRAVIEKYETEMELHCRDNNSVMLSDLIKRIGKLLDNENFQAEMKRHTLEYLFVDEFQDTDDTQIEIMKAFSDLFGFKFFVVGDVKQCIYRFRGAQVQAFDTLDNKKAWARISLNKNYRSDIKLLDCMNREFANWGGLGRLAYDSGDELVGVRNMPEVDAATCFVRISADGDWQTPLLKLLLQPQVGTTAILVRMNWQKNQIVEFCKQHNIPVETDIGGELFKIDPTIDFFKLVQALRFSHDAEYVVNLFTTSYTESTIDKKAVLEQGAEAYLANNPPFPEWVEFLDKLRLEPILKVLRDIINKIQPWRIAADRVEPRNRKAMQRYYLENLDILFENLLEKANSDYFTLNNISEYLEVMILTKQEKEARVSYRQNDDGGKLICTTIHKAKGLEYDTVILPFCDLDISGKRKTGSSEVLCMGQRVGYRLALQGELWLAQLENDIYTDLRTQERDIMLQEETRILYVAMTRAKKKFIYFVNAATTNRVSWQDMIRGGGAE